MGGAHENSEIVRAMLTLAQNLGKDVIAEGIESTVQADTVFAAGCRFAQGHLYGRGMPISEVARALSERGGAVPGS